MRRLKLLVWIPAVLFVCFANNSYGDEPLLCQKAKLLFEDTFDEQNVSEKWKPAKGQWKIVGAAMQGTELKADNHAASIRTDVELPEIFVLSFDFQFDGGKVIHCSFNGKGHICRATITPTGYTLKGEKDKKNAQDKSVTVGQVQQDFEKGKWYTMQIEVAGKEMVARVGDGPVAFGAHEKIARPKNNFGFPMAGVSSKIDNVKIWSADLNPKWSSIKSSLPANKIVPPAPRTAAQRFAVLDKDKDKSVSLKEFLGNRPKDKHAALKRGFERKDKDGSGALSVEEYSATAPPKKKK